MNNKFISIGGTKIIAGERKIIELDAACLYTQTPIKIPVHVLHGKKSGPKIFVIAAVHGDEINGVEIIRRLLTHNSINEIKGTLIAVPIANVYGFVSLSRYMPDRRDLNRSFPGSRSGSLASRIAKVLMDEIISQCTHGIDLHTGNLHLENLPHVRTNLDIEDSLKMAKAFNVPVVLNAKLRDGSIRQAAGELNIPVLTYEGGEALRFNELAIRAGLRGVLNTLGNLGMIKISKVKKIKPKITNYSVWVRSPESGIVRPLTTLGSDVEKGEKIGVITDPFSKKETEIISTITGVVIGKNSLPLVNSGDALFHIAHLRSSSDITSDIIEFQHELLADPLTYS